MKYFLDTNIFLRSVVVEDKKTSDECKRLFAEIKKRSISAVTAGIVSAEIAWVLSKSYEFPKEELIKILDGLANSSGLEICNDYDLMKAVEIYKKFNVKYIDAMIASLPKVRSGEWTVVSYDQDFKKLPVKWMKPGEVA
ncbi:MAG: PIN domain-containing protein [Patescibacteria group bacterium]